MRSLYPCLLALVSVVLAGCPGDSSSSDDKVWSCYPSGNKCSCELVVQPPDAPDFENTDNVCGLRSCCFLDESKGTCECMDTDEACKDEKPQGATLVGQCPPHKQADNPLGFGEIPACRKAGTACDTYEQQCCAGLACTADSDTEASCQPANAETLGALRLCANAGYHDEPEGEIAPKALKTSVGTITLPPLDSTRVLIGPQGCVNRIAMTLKSDITSFSDACSLKLEAELEGTRMVVTSIQAQLADCPGYEGTGDSISIYDVSEDDPAALSGFEFSFDGVACGDHNHTYDGERYCVQGTLTWRMRGIVSDVDFGDQTLTVEGGFCSSDPLVGECPEP